LKPHEPADRDLIAKLLANLRQKPIANAAVTVLD